MQRMTSLVLLGFALCAATACSPEGEPTDPKCSIDPSTLSVGDAYAVNISGAGANNALVVDFSSASHTDRKNVKADGSGKVDVAGVASQMGALVVEIKDASSDKATILATCTATVTDSCGDGVCADNETCDECNDDCGICDASCGDGFCNNGENCGSCEEDCGSCSSACGDGACNLTESCATCSEDCGQCAASCGNGSCDANESCATCAADCDCSASCGDGTCGAGETCTTCEDDCGACATCGDDRCDASETCTSCAGDCGACPATCGDGTCGNGETCNNCANDCGQCAPVCGDLLCNGTETCSSCSLDCGPCTGTCEQVSNNLPSGRHKAGTACIGCHSEFSIAGTVYSNAAGSGAVSGATMTVTDANGEVVKLISASNGNFYSYDSYEPPLTVVGSRCPTIHVMNGEADGDCNACHRSGNRIYIE